MHAHALLASTVKDISRHNYQYLAHTIQDVHRFQKPQRVPYLLTLVREIHYLELGWKCIVIDPTGEIEMSVPPATLKQARHAIRIGAVMVFKDVPLGWRRGYSPYLVATDDCIEHIFTPQQTVDEEPRVMISTQAFSSAQDVANGQNQLPRQQESRRQTVLAQRIDGTQPEINQHITRTARNDNSNNNNAAGSSLNITRRPPASPLPTCDNSESDLENDLAYLDTLNQDCDDGGDYDGC
ncbi:hypothetical protein EV182_006668 [Spiromyces aspiralis]|uniref:Uncharacterized protein n=1 Tax=Spiromyces aspiralis TaxID=68401 RepID=A0ACC1HPE8_9FUNG|nr:hypothetical protein EV182_006668 [Spiromyces aspiralis]